MEAMDGEELRRERERNSRDFGRKLMKMMKKRIG